VSQQPSAEQRLIASVRQRLFNLAKAQGRDFGAILRLFFLERFLYRLSVSRYAKSFLLKGALLFFARAAENARPLARPTKDLERTDAPERFEDAMNRVTAFVGPPYLDACAGKAFIGRWVPASRAWLRP
jgi:hypothetical protein